MPDREYRSPVSSDKPDERAGLLLTLKPRKEAHETVRRTAQVSPREKTGKDFVDLLCILDVLIGIRPLSEEMLEKDNWKSYLPDCFSGGDAVSQTLISGRTGQYYIIIYILDETYRPDLDKWKKLMEMIVRKFF